MKLDKRRCCGSVKEDVKTVDVCRKDAQVRNKLRE